MGCGVIARAGMRVDPSDPTLVQLNVAAEQGERGETADVPKLPKG